MKKLSDILLNLFSVGILLALFAGALSLLGFVISMFIGGEIAANISVFIHQIYFPYVIRITSIFVALGLAGMYFAKTKALSITDNTSVKNK